LYRAFHALPPLTNGAGEPTGAIYGMTNMLRKLLREYQPERIAVIFDPRGKTFRHEMFADYKAHRPPVPEELSAQFAGIRDIVRALGLPFVQMDGVEADDVIGTLARRAQEEVLIVTGDKDMAQLVDDRVALLDTMQDKRTDAERVLEKFGVGPDRVPDYLALVGDSSDNIPGVPKVGPKTAAKWLETYGDLDGVIEHAGEIGGKVGEYLRETLDDLPLYKDLATIRCDLDLDFGLGDLNRGQVDEDALRDLYRDFEFQNWLREIDRGRADAERGEVVYHTILERADFDAMLERLRAAELICVDTETDSLEAMRAGLVGLSFAVEAGEAWYLPVGHDYPGAPDQLPRDEVLAALKPILEDPAIPKLGQHLKYDLNVLARHGIDLAGCDYDTMLESYVLNSTASRHDMDSLALQYLNRTTVKFEDVAGKGAKQITFNQVGLEEAAPYAAEDADVTLQLHRTLYPRLEKDAPLKALFHEIEMPLMPVLAGMERSGVKIDVKLLGRISRELAERMVELEKTAHEEAGGRFNLGSPNQLQDILFRKLELPALRKTPKGAPSTAEDVLAELADRHPLPRLILEWRELSKLRSTYADKLPEMVNPETRRVHTSYHQAVAATGRLSSSDPNLQNIPVRTAAGRRIREAFVAPQNGKLLAVDYSQIELRIMAHLSGDEGLITAFTADRDIHRATAAEVFDTPLDEITTEQRRAAKAINFGLMYGMSAFGLGRQLGIGRKEADAYIERFFERFAGVRKFMDDTRRLAREQGYVETLFGRRLYLPEIDSRNSQRRAYAERTAINAPLQGTAADLIKKAMIELAAWLPESALMIMQVHDELVFEVPAGDAEKLAGRISERMCGVAELEVPLVAETGIGDNWEQAH
jgi:DNA polymerase-1